MKRGTAPYMEGNVNAYMATQLQQMSAQRMQQQSPGMNSFPGRPDSFPAEEERPYASAQPEGQWHWERDAQRMSPHLYSEGRAIHQNQIRDPRSGSPQEGRVHPQDQDMEIGYDDKPALQSLEALERKFNDDLMKLTKDQIDAEDAENARHREKIVEINNDYQENLSALRARHASRREEFLRRESQARLQQYQLATMNHYQNNTGPSDVGHRGFGGAPAPGPGVVSGEAPLPYGGGQFDSYRQHPESFGRGGRMQARVPTPGGRVYNTGPRYY
ncbi:hypothetical protein Ancab_001126 [Ancistrocladus abbreviatus]